MARTIRSYKKINLLKKNINIFFELQFRIILFKIYIYRCLKVITRLTLLL